MSISEIAHPSDQADRVPLSFNQEFLCNFDDGTDNGPFGSAYNIVTGWRLSGAVDVETLRAALGDLVARHETLRTLIVNNGEERYQRIDPPSVPELTVLDLRDVAPEDRERRVEQMLCDGEAAKHTARELPLIRAVLGQFDDTDSALVFSAHHSAVDEWSLQLIMRDVAAFYIARKTGQEPDLPEMAQYREFSAKELAKADSPAVNAARAYWRTKLTGARLTPTPLDIPRSEGLPKITSWHRFLIEKELTAPVATLARELRCTPFMVLLAAYKVMLHKASGSTDITVATFTAGRGDARFHHTVGSFFNFVPLRTDLSGCANFREVVKRTRATCLEAYKHDIPFGQIMAEAPELMASVMTNTDAGTAFQVIGSPFVADTTTGELRYSAFRRRVMSQEVGGDIPDGALLQLGVAPEGDLVGTLGFNSNLLRESTMLAMLDDLRAVLADHVAKPDAAL
ncbi:condensation domain-containing protein [Actinokineospora sp.]|uniref:condensation domain-containing protein n=1 Tax=Actinokineospora sp. TaxID=1872133 RepID=UPI003D6B7165